MATGYIALERHEDARKSLDELTKLPLDDAQSLQAASLLLSIQQNSQAISVIQQLVRRAPPLQARWAQFDLALTYLLAGEYEKTIEQALACTEAVPTAGPEASETADAWSLIGIAYAHNNQGERSVAALRQAGCNGMGAGTLSLRSLGRRCLRKIAVRPVLRQAHVAWLRRQGLS